MVEKFGCLPSREEQLRVFERRMLRIFGCTSEEVAGCWQKLIYEEVHNLHILPNIVIVIFKELGHLLICNGLTHPNMSLKVLYSIIHVVCGFVILWNSISFHSVNILNPFNFRFQNFVQHRFVFRYFNISSFLT
jgi:hypothetical protein